jgi:hypothetical protein
MKSFDAAILSQITSISIRTVEVRAPSPLREWNKNDVNVDSNKNSCCEWNDL